jgi:hypothetical protein
MKANKLEVFITRQGALIIVLLMLSVLGYYLWRFSSLGYGNQAELGQFGDYFGGILNPMLSFSAFIVLIYTYRHQLKEKEEADKRHSEVMVNSRFFEMISILNQLAESVEVDVHSYGPEGGNTLVSVRSTKTYRGHRGIGRAWNILRNALQAEAAGAASNVEDAIPSYKDWERIYWPSIESYYDSALFIIDEYVCNEDCKDREYYAAVMRSQMSTNEKNLLLLMTSKEKRGGRRFAALAALGFWESSDPILLKINEHMGN